MSGTAFFGKVPSAADFVRRGIAGPTLRAFEHWFHDNYTDLRGTGARGLPFECRVIYPDPKGEGIVAAVAIPSRDRIGRQFPAVVVSSLSKEQLPSSVSALVLGLERFWRDAVAVVQAHVGGEPEPLLDAATAVTGPSRAELADAAERGTALLGNLSEQEMEQACFEEPDDRFYAYQTLRLAVRNAPIPDGRVVWCPTAKNASYRLFWIETIARATEHEVPLPMMWLEGADAPDGALVALGRAPANMLRFAMGHGRSSNMLWPLTTSHAGAKERAKAALEEQNWDDDEQQLSGLIDVVLSIQV